ncbi:MAG: hypothetical protein WA151_24205 [Desulfatirhabdiaceae bacterium]
MSVLAMVGHSDEKTTMSYTHCIPSRTPKVARSPWIFNRHG